MSFLTGLFGDSLGNNHKDPGSGLTSKLGNYLDPLYWALGKNSGYANLKNKVYDQTARVPNELNRVGSQIITPLDNAVAPYTDPLYYTGVGKGVHQMVNNKPVSALAAALTGAGLAGSAGGGAAAGGGGSGLGAGGTFSGALGAEAAVPTFGAAAPSIGGTGTIGAGGAYLGAGEAAVPSVGGSGAAAFGSGSSGSGLNFNTQKFAQNFLQNQGQSTSQQKPPPTYRSQLLDNYQPFQQTPADFNPSANKGAPGDQQLMMLIQALRSQNGQ